MCGKVLVVDDERAVAKTICETLRAAGYETDMAQDVDGANKLLAETSYDVVLTDIVLPRVSGNALLRSIKQTSPDVQVIVMSGAPTAETASEALRAGAIDYLFKPIDKQTLLKSIGEAARVKRLEDEKAALEAQNQRYQQLLEELVEERTKELAESEARYRQLVENLYEGILVLDDKCRMTFVNPHMAEILGEPREKLLRTPIGDFLDDATRAFFSLHVEQWKNGGRDGVDLELQRRDGTRVYTRFEVSPTFNGNGDFLGMTAAVADLTARHEAEREKLYLATALEQVAETIFITDSEGVIQYANPAFEQISGYTREEAIGKTPAIVRSGQHDDTFYQSLWDTIKSGESWFGHFTNMRKNGTLYEEEASITPVIDESGEVCRFIAVKRDVTDKMLAERRLRQAQKMEALGALAGGIAHDFNNLLAAIMGYGEIARGELPEDSSLKADLDQILAAGERARQLVRQILLFSHQAEEERKPVNIHLIAGEVLKFLCPTLPATISIRSCIDKEAGRVSADPTQLHQVLMNLCTNAYQAMKDTGGTLEVGLAPCTIDFEDEQSRLGLPEGQYVHLWVSDTGPGIPIALQERVFEPFFTTKGPNEGTGMGLAIVHGIASSCGGTVTVQSEPGKGARFDVYFPRLIEESSCRSQPETGARGGTECILLVDDEVSLCRMVERALKKLGYEVDAVTDGIAALNLFLADPNRFDIIITDHLMPRMTGLQLAESVRMVRPEMPLILMTGSIETVDADTAHAHGFSAFVPKPANLKTVARTVREILDTATAATP